MAAAWAINLAVAERAIRAPPPSAGAPPARSVWRRAMNAEQTGHARRCYELRIDGHLDEHWSTWFDGLTIIHETTARPPFAAP